MLEKPLDEISWADIEQLQREGVREQKTIDYKAALPGKTDSDKKEFLADVSSFANTSGGHIVYGVKEDKGIPVEICGLTGLDLDQERLRLDNMIRDGIKPRIPAVHSEVVKGSGEAAVLVLRVPKSWQSPHMVSFQEASRFFLRSSAGKYPMDITEIRAQFALSEELPRRIEAFRDRRLSRILTGDTPVRLVALPRVVVHLLPAQGVANRTILDASLLGGQESHFRIDNTNAWNSHINIDGFLMYGLHRPDGGDLSVSYCQAFRTGCLEYVSVVNIHEPKLDPKFPAQTVERFIIKSTTSGLTALKNLGVDPPVFVFVSIVGFLGARFFPQSSASFVKEVRIDRDPLLLPEITISSYNIDVAGELRSAFDILWNAGGHERSLSYVPDGTWRPRPF